MSDHTPTERQWLILRSLATRRFGMTLRELADELEVTQRTIHRDLVLLRNVGFPVHPRTSEHGRKHWTATFSSEIPPLSFDVSEILAIYLSRTLLEPLAGTMIWDASQSAFRKIKATLGESALAYLQKLGQLLHRTSFRDSDYQDKSQLIDDLMVGLEERRIAHIEYHSARSTEPLTYPVYPYGIVFHRGSLYLIAQSEQHNEIRNFKLDRISLVELESMRFPRPKNFNLQDYLRNSLGVYQTDAEPQKVVVRFSAQVARYVREHRWHESQQISEANDGSLDLSVRLSSFEEIKSWVLSFGKEAVVLEPDKLREMIRHELDSMIEPYAAVK